MSDALNPLSADGWPPEDFAHHHDYSTLMLGARRNAAPHIGAPAITRHLGFWVPDELTLKSDGSMTLRRDEWVEHIERSFVALYLRLKKVSRVSTSSRQKRGHDSKRRLYLIHHSYPIKEGDRAPECIKGAKELPIRHQRFVLSFVWQSLPVGLTLEMFDEYFTLSTAIDLSHCSASDATLPKAIRTFNDLASKRCDTIRKGEDGAASAPRESEFTSAFKDIYYTAWKDLYEIIFPGPLTACAATLGKVFAEFRGFVACRDGSHFIAADGKAERRLEKEIGNKRFKGKNAIRCVDAIRPFLAADTWLHRKPNDKRGAKYPESREFTFTPVLNGRYIYASALGTPPFHLRDRHTRLTYMLLAANHCPSELGLLVDGLHVLGTTRLAALYDFPHLTHAALELRDLEGEISAFQRGMMEAKPDNDVPAVRERLAQELPGFSGRLAKIERGITSEDDDKRTHAASELSELERDTSKLHRSMMERKPDDDVAAPVERLAQKLRDFAGRFAKIEQDIRSQNGDKRTYAALELGDLEGEISALVRGMEGKPDEGAAAAAGRLAHRLRYFSGRFAKIEQGIAREDDDNKPQIAGGLPFRVERSQYYQRQFRGLVRGLRIGRIQGFLTYDEAVARRLGGIYDLINTVGLRHERLREILTGLSRRVQTARQLEQTGAITDETRTIEKLQKGAEIAFFAFLFPYYVSHVVTDLAAKIQLAEIFPLIERWIEIDRTILFYSIAIGVTWALYPWLIKKFRVTRSSTKRFKRSLIAFVVIAPLLLSVLATLTIHTPPSLCAAG
jgi:hypothetical protein